MERIPQANYCLECGTELERRSVLGRLRPVCPACGYVHFRDPKVAAAVVIFDQGRVLLAQRSNVPEQGRWSLPAGFVDAGEDPRQAAERECAEETGLRVRITELIDVLFNRDHARGASILIVYRAEIEGGQLKAGDDAEAVGWFDLDRLPELAFNASRDVLARFSRGA